MGVQRHSDRRDLNKIMAVDHDPPNQYKPQDNEIQEIVPIKSEPHENTIPTTPQHTPTTLNTQSTMMQENSLTQYQQDMEEEEVYDDEYGQYGDQYGLAEQDINTHHGQQYQADKGRTMSYEDLTQYIGHNPNQR